MKIVSWNVNSIRRRMSLVSDFLSAESPDVLCIQETRCNDGSFPRQAFVEAGYEAAHYGSGGSGGVAIVSKIGLENISYGFGGELLPPFDEPRLLAADVGDMRLMTLYAPNGRRMRTAAWQFKLAWFELLRVVLELELAESPRLVIAGDFNVCPAPIDVYDPVKKRNRNLVSEPERAAVRRLLDLGLVDLARDLHPDNPGFTWFAFTAGQFAANRGYRLDLMLTSPAVTHEFRSCRPLGKWREPDLGPSDHAPLMANA